SITAIPIDRSRADVWVGHPEVPSVDLGRPIAAALQSYLAGPELEGFPEVYLQGFAYWDRPIGGTELCIVIGTRLTPDALGPVEALTPELRVLLTEPGAIVVDEAEFGRLGVSRVGHTAEVAGRRVRIVGTIRGYKSTAGPYVFCSLETARTLL